MLLFLYLGYSTRKRNVLDYRYFFTCSVRDNCRFHLKIHIFNRLLLYLGVRSLIWTTWKYNLIWHLFLLYTRNFPVDFQKVGKIEHLNRYSRTVPQSLIRFVSIGKLERCVTSRFKHLRNTRRENLKLQSKAPSF